MSSVPVIVELPSATVFSAQDEDLGTSKLYPDVDGLAVNDVLMYSGGAGPEWWISLD